MYGVAVVFFYGREFRLAIPLTHANDTPPHLCPTLLIHLNWWLTTRPTPTDRYCMQQVALHDKAAPSSPVPVAETAQPNSHKNAPIVPRETPGTTTHTPSPVAVESSSSTPTTPAGSLADSLAWSSASTTLDSFVEVSETPSMEGTPPQQDPNGRKTAAADASLASSSMHTARNGHHASLLVAYSASERPRGDAGMATGDTNNGHHTQAFLERVELAGAEEVGAKGMLVPANGNDVAHENPLGGQKVKPSESGSEKNHKNTAGLSVAPGVTVG